MGGLFIIAMLVCGPQDCEPLAFGPYEEAECEEIAAALPYEPPNDGREIVWLRCIERLPEDIGQPVSNQN